jgi:hypothetical protein
MRRQNGIECEALWRLDAPQTDTVNTGFNKPASTASQAVDHGQRRSRAWLRGQCCQDAVDHRLRYKWPRRVMNEHDFRAAIAGNGFKPGTHRGLPRRAAVNRWRQVKPGDCGSIRFGIIGVDDDAHSIYARVVV